MLLANHEVDKGALGGALAARGRHGARAAQLRADAGVGGRQALLDDGGQVLPDLAHGVAQARRRDGQVVGRRDPLDVGAEAQAAGQVERQVRAQAAEAGLGRRVDQARGGGAAGAVGEVVALGVEGGAVAGGREDEVGDGAGAEAGGVDERGCCEGGFFVCGVVASCDCVAGNVWGGADGGDGGYG